MVCIRSAGLICLGWMCGWSPASGQVVQLPSFRTFSYSGTVVVPDSGTAALGGNRTAASHSSQRGLGRGVASQLGSSQASVTATIIDHQQLDRQLLGGSPQQFLASDRGQRRAVDSLAEGKALVRHARAQYRGGDHAAAFDAYLVAIEILPTDLRQLAINEFRRVFGPAADQAMQVAARVRR